MNISKFTLVLLCIAGCKTTGINKAKNSKLGSQSESDPFKVVCLGADNSSFVAKKISMKSGKLGDEVLKSFDTTDECVRFSSGENKGN